MDTMGTADQGLEVLRDRLGRHTAMIGINEVRLTSTTDATGDLNILAITRTVLLDNTVLLLHPLLHRVITSVSDLNHLGRSHIPMVTGEAHSPSQAIALPVRSPMRWTRKSATATQKT
jgi:hypothetical protein